MAERRDDLFASVAGELGYLTAQQISEAQEAQQAATGLGMDLALSDVLVSKKLLTREQTEEVTRIVRVRAGDAHVVGEYKVLSKLGEGGMGVVYKAEHSQTGQLVALKVLPPALARNATLLRRFVREAEITRTLQHPNMVRCIELGLDKERKLHYFAMEYIEGEDLARRIKRTSAIPEREALDIARQIASALQHAHEKGLVHRDVKPQNIMLTADGTAKLLDLGLARSVETEDTRLTQTGMFTGSPHYASPEQAVGTRETDIRSDIYSLGATLYHALTGATPFEGDTPGAVLAKVVNETVRWPSEVRPDVSEAASRVVEKAMARDPALRHQTPRDLSDHLTRVLEGHPLPSDDAFDGASVVVRAAARPRRRRPPEQAGEPARSHAGLLYAAVGGGIILVVGALFALAGGPDGADEAVMPPDIAAPVAPPPRVPAATAPATDDRRLEEMLAVADAYAAGNPGEFEHAVLNYRKVQREGRGTRFELLADAQAAEVNKRRDAAAGVALIAAQGAAAPALERLDVDAALAEFERIPRDLAAPVSGQIDRARKAIVERARSAANDIDEAVKRAIAARDLAAARAGLERLRTLRYAPEQRAIDDTCRRLAARLADAEKEQQSDLAAKAAGALPQVLDRFDELLSAGAYAEGRRSVADAGADPALASVAETLAAAGRVADALLGRANAIRAAAEALVGTTVTLQTAKGQRRGEVTAVGDAAISLDTKIIINGQVRGTSKSDVAFVELAAAEAEKLARDWRPAGADGQIAVAYAALRAGDADRAEKALAEAAGHPLASRIRDAIDVRTMGAGEAAAMASWRRIEARGRATKLTSAEGRELASWLDEFDERHGTTKLAATVKDAEAQLRARATEAQMTWTAVAPADLRVQTFGAATAAVRGDVLAVSTPAGLLNRTEITVLDGIADSRLRFEYSGPALEVSLRRTGWRGAVLVLLAPDMVSVRTYPDEDQNRPLQLAQAKIPGRPGPGWHALDATATGTTFSLALDGVSICRTDTLPAGGAGATQIAVLDTRGDAMQIRNVSYSILEPVSGQTQGILTDKGADWVDVKADREPSARRHTIVDAASRRPDASLAAVLAKAITANRVTATWDVVAGRRQLRGLTMLPPATMSGTTSGEVIDKGLTWLDVRSDADPPERYSARWMGGMPDQGGGPEARITVALLQIKVGDRVRIDWVYDNRKRIAEVATVGRPGMGSHPPIPPGEKFHDTFESGPDGWQVVKFAEAVIGEITIANAPGIAKKGARALALSYSLAPGKVPVMMRPASEINHLSLWVRTTKMPVNFVVLAAEKDDDSRYQTLVHLEPADGWKQLDFDLSTFTLADDSRDENGRLDVDQIVHIGIIEISGILLQSGDNALLLDEVVGEFRPGPR